VSGKASSDGSVKLSYIAHFKFATCLITSTAPPEGNEAVYSIVSTRAGNPPSRKDVGGQFKAELSTKGSHQFLKAICEAADSHFASVARLLRVSRL
jgi:hypothetical protein